jgi:hypothetical protein
MISAVDQLAADDLIENHIVPQGNLGEQSRFRATPKLMALVEESRISLMLDRPEIIILRDADTRAAWGAIANNNQKQCRFSPARSESSLRSATAESLPWSQSGSTRTLVTTA